MISGKMGIDEGKQLTESSFPRGNNDAEVGGILVEGDHDLGRLGYKQELRRNRSLITLLFQTLAIAAIPYGEGGPLSSAIYGGGQLSVFVGWIVVLVLDECIALSLRVRIPVSNLCRSPLLDVSNLAKWEDGPLVYQRVGLAHWQLDYYTLREFRLCFAYIGHCLDVPP